MTLDLIRLCLTQRRHIPPPLLSQCVYLLLFHFFFLTAAIALGMGSNARKKLNKRESNKNLLFSLPALSLSLSLVLSLTHSLSVSVSLHITLARSHTCIIILCTYTRTLTCRKTQDLWLPYLATVNPDAGCGRWKEPLPPRYADTPPELPKIHPENANRKHRDVLRWWMCQPIKQRHCATWLVHK